jgi:hypothetical protein
METDAVAGREAAVLEAHGVRVAPKPGLGLAEARGVPGREIDEPLLEEHSEPRGPW